MKLTNIGDIFSFIITASFPLNLGEQALLTYLLLEHNSQGRQLYCRSHRQQSLRPCASYTSCDQCCNPLQPPAHNHISFTYLYYVNTRRVEMKSTVYCNITDAGAILHPKTSSVLQEGNCGTNHIRQCYFYTVCRMLFNVCIQSAKFKRCKSKQDQYCSIYQQFFVKMPSSEVH